MSSPIAWVDVTSAFASDLKLAAVSVPAQTVYLSIVNGSGLNVYNFGGENTDLTRSARIFLAAHYATLGNRAGAGVSGPITAQGEGDANQSYWFGWQNPAMLYLTGYGQMLIQLIKGTPARAGTLV